ncbi:MAG: phosphatidate cytidylyltransferase [Myxococcales bacterium]|nr:phosphatidate cytidylyltransferase [Myxococcales bacterium]MCB9751877.1 phosphatidate cytidylyltransferase [Myxococcales bacterium]
MSNLTQRLLTAAVLVPILVVALFYDPTPWSILALAVFAGGFAHDEFLRMSLPVAPDGTGDRAVGLRAVTLLCGAALSILCCVFGPGAAMAPTLTVTALVLGAAVLTRKHALDLGARHVMACYTSVVYVPLLVTVWALIKSSLPNGASWLFVTLGIAFGTDTFAYFAGRAFGKHKLYPEVSPKKTWEGSAGGLLGGVFVTTTFGCLWMLPELPVVHAVALGVVGSAFGQVGDLVESLFKRGFKVKDSGNLLPGHGGMLDRVDGLLFVAPVVYYYVTLILPLAG